MMRAIFNGVVIAESASTQVVEGNHYFPPESLATEHLTGSPRKTLCYWKGLARYYTVTAGGRTSEDAAWYYPHPSPLARRIKNHVAFGGEVTVREETS